MPHPSGATHKYDPEWMKRAKSAESGDLMHNTTKPTADAPPPPVAPPSEPPVSED